MDKIEGAPVTHAALYIMVSWTAGSCAAATLLAAAGYHRHRWYTRR